MQYTIVLKHKYIVKQPTAVNTLVINLLLLVFALALAARKVFLTVLSQIGRSRPSVLFFFAEWNWRFGAINKRTIPSEMVSKHAHTTEKHHFVKSNCWGLLITGAFVTNSFLFIYEFYDTMLCRTERFKVINAFLSFLNYRFQYKFK